MKTVTIVTPANIEVEYRLAGAGSRLAAFTMDFLLQTAVCLLIAVVVLFVSGGLRWPAFFNTSGFSNAPYSSSYSSYSPYLSYSSGLSYGLAFIIILLFAVYCGYFLACEMLMNGQSFGKRIFGLRVIRDNGMPVGLSQSLLRNVFRIALDMWYVGLFVILFSKKHKRIGDMVAGTVVVSEHRPIKANSITITAFPTLQASKERPIGVGSADHNHNQHLFALRYPHIQISEEERRVLIDWLTRRNDLPLGGKNIHRQLAAYFSHKWQAEVSLFTVGVLEHMAAYYIRRG